MEKLNGIQKILREEPIFFSRLGFCYDPPIVGDDGKPVVFSNTCGITGICSNQA